MISTFWWLSRAWKASAGRSDRHWGICALSDSAAPISECLEQRDWGQGLQGKGVSTGSAGKRGRNWKWEEHITDTWGRAASTQSRRTDPLELERRKRSSSEHGRKVFQENHLKAPSSLSWGKMSSGSLGRLRANTQGLWMKRKGEHPFP